jgi:hypothetical protein
MMTREEHESKMAELRGKRTRLRFPRRSFTAGFLPEPTALYPGRPTTPLVGIASPDAASQEGSAVQDAVLGQKEAVKDNGAAKNQQQEKPPPRRSYSVMDYAPVPITHKPSSRLQLIDLPNEIHHSIFDFLDHLDGTVLGLTSRHFYAIQRMRIGKVPLNLGRMQPNDLEWCWRTSGTRIQQCSRDVLQQTFPLRSSEGNLDAIREYSELSKYRLKGLQLCAKCGHLRCQLWKHIKETFPDELEYCSISGKVGTSPQREEPVLDEHYEYYSINGKVGPVSRPSDAAPGKSYQACHRRSPRHPGLCGIHHPKKTKTRGGYATAL